MEDNKTTQSETSGSDFQDHLSAVDKAKNERIKEDPRSKGREQEQMNRAENRSSKTDVSTKKSGGGKQSNPGS